MVFINFKTDSEAKKVTPHEQDKSLFIKHHQLEIKKFEDGRKEQLKKFEINKNGSNQTYKTSSDFSTEVVKIDLSNSTEKTLEHSSKLSLIKNRFLDWGSNTSSHGIPNMIRLESPLLKLIWFICFLASFGYCVYTIVSIVMAFLKFDVLINQNVETSTPVDFPAVTVCNLNPFDRRQAQYYINQTLEKNGISYVNDINKIDINPKLVNTLIKSSIIGDKNLTLKSKEKLGFELDYMLLTCYFNDAPCNKTDFVWRYDFDYLNCYTFNSGFDQDGNEVPVKQINEAGSDQSLKLELFLGYDLTQSQYILNSGARVVVHNQSITPIISSEGIDISTGFQTNIGIKRSFLYKMDSPYSDCIKNTKSSDSYNSKFYKAIFHILNMTTYRQKFCLRLCLQEFIRKKCNCIDGSLPNIYQNSTICQSVSSLECVANSRVDYFSDQDSSSCSDCPLECDSTSFQLTSSSSRYPTRYYQNYLSSRTNILSKFPSGTSSSEITKSTVLLNVFYDDLATTYTSELPAVTAISLLGNIGGNLGLFIGISLLTFVEIIELLFEFFFICFNRFRE